jgi:hypothetical protein
LEKVETGQEREDEQVNLPFELPLGLDIDGICRRQGGRSLVIRDDFLLRVPRGLRFNINGCFHDEDILDILRESIKNESDNFDYAEGGRLIICPLRLEMGLGSPSGVKVNLKAVHYCMP